MPRYVNVVIQVTRYFYLFAFYKWCISSCVIGLFTLIRSVTFIIILFSSEGYATVYSLELGSVSCDIIGCCSGPEDKTWGISGWDECSNEIPPACKVWGASSSKDKTWLNLFFLFWPLLVLLQSRTYYSCVITGAITRLCEDAVDSFNYLCCVKAPNMKWGIRWERNTVCCPPFVIGGYQ